jgi:hypothetical protein
MPKKQIKSKITLVLTLETKRDGDYINIQIKNPKRITQHGFGLFLENVDPKEIVAGEGVIAALCRQPERSGLCDMEFWPHKILAFPGTMAKVSRINVPDGAKTWIRQFSAK